MWGLHAVLTAFQHGRQVEHRLAYNHQHGAWLEWLDSGDNAETCTRPMGSKANEVSQ